MVIIAESVQEAGITAIIRPGCPCDLTAMLLRSIFLQKKLWELSHTPFQWIKLLVCARKAHGPIAISIIKNLKAFLI